MPVVIEPFVDIVTGLQAVAPTASGFCAEILPVVIFPALRVPALKLAAVLPEVEIVVAPGPDRLASVIISEPFNTGWADLRSICPPPVVPETVVFIEPAEKDPEAIALILPLVEPAEPLLVRFVVLELEGRLMDPPLATNVILPPLPPVPADVMYDMPERFMDPPVAESPVIVYVFVLVEVVFVKATPAAASISPPVPPLVSR